MQQQAGEQANVVPANPVGGAESRFEERLEALCAEYAMPEATVVALLALMAQEV